MKRSLFIAIVVLLMAALFVSCNAEKSMEDQLVEVTVGGASRTIEASATLDVDTENLYWFYTAKKLGGIFKEGEKLTLTPVKTSNDAPAVGLKESSLGQMSTGPWEFSFYGFSSATDVSDLTKAVYQQTSLKVQVNAAIALAVTLERGTGELPPARVGFAAAGLTWMIDGVGTELTLNMTIYEGDVAFLAGPVVGTYSTDLQKYVFIPGTDAVEVADGQHDYTVRVYNSYLNPVTDTNDTELVGETVLTIVAQSGMVYIIGDVSGTTGITAVTPQPVDVEIGVPTKPLEATTVVAASTAAQTVSTNVSPAGASTGATQVSFPANSFEDGTTDMKLDVVTYSTEAAAAKFTVADGSTVVAGIDFTLSAGDQAITEFNGNEATITTFITKNLNESDVHVYYVGDTTLTDYKVSYESSTGKLIFKTTHFSEYYVVSKSVALIGERAYATLEDAVKAVQDGQTIKLLVDADITSSLNFTKNDVVLDLNGKTIFNTNDIWCVHSAGDWSLVSVSGSLTIKGNGKLLAKENDCYAIDIWGDGTCTIEDGTFVGNITAVYAYKGTAIINGGTFSILQLSSYNDCRYLLNLLDANGNNGTAKIIVNGGSFNQFNPADNLAENPQVNFVSAGYCSVADGDSWTVAPAFASIDGVGYQSLAAAIAAVPATNEATTVVVLKDTVIAGNAGITIPAGKNVILDLNGHVVKNAVNENKASQVFVNRGTLTIKDSTDTAKNGTGTGLLENGIEEGTQPGEWWSTPQYNYATNVITNSGTLTIESGKIEQTAAGSICYAVDNNSTSYDTTLIINGGLVTDDYGTVIRLFCNSDVKENNIVIHGGKVETTGSAAIWVHLPGSKATSMKKASVTIDGGVIAAGTNAVYDYSYGDGWDNVVYNISGGTFLGIISSQKPDYKFISGGTFPTTANVRWGYVFIEDGDVYVEDANGDKAEKYDAPWDKKDYWEEQGYTFTYDSSWGDYVVKIEMTISDIIGDYLVAGCSIVDNNDGTSTVATN